MSTSSSCCTICVCDQISKATRQVVLTPGFPAQELHLILVSAFSLQRKVVGLRDDRNIYYTLSTVCRNPANFSRIENKLTLIFESDGATEQAYKLVDYEDSEGSIQSDAIAERAFHLMDGDGDGQIDLGDIAGFIRHGATTQSLYHETPEPSQASIDELVELFVSTFYEELAISYEEAVSLNDFCAWFLSTNHVGLRTLVCDICKLYSSDDNSNEPHPSLSRSKSTPNLHSVLNSDDATTSSYNSFNTFNSSLFSKEPTGGHYVHDHVSTLAPIKVVIDEIRKHLRLDNSTLKGLYYAFYESGSDEGDFMVSRQKFNSRIYSLIKMVPSKLNDSFDLETIQNMINSLYSAFSTSESDSVHVDDDDCIVSISSILCGMNLFCKGDVESNLAFTYNWFLSISDGFVSSGCVRRFILNICNVMYSISNELVDLVELKSSTFAGYISNAVFRQIAVSNPRHLTRLEFVDCCRYGLDIIFQIVERELDVELVLGDIDEKGCGSPDASFDEGSCNSQSVDQLSSTKSGSGLSMGQSSVTSSNTDLSRASTVSSKSNFRGASIASSASGSSGLADLLKEYEGGTVNITDAHRILGLKNVSPSSILRHISISIGPNNNGDNNNEEDYYLRRFEYNKLMQALCVGNGKNHAALDSHEKKIFDFLINRLFSAYSVTSSDQADAHPAADLCDSLELGIALLAFSGGSTLEKALAVLELLRRLGYVGDNAKGSTTKAEDEGLSFLNNVELLNEVIDVSFLSICSSPIYKLIGALDPKFINLETFDDIASHISARYADEHDLENTVPCNILARWLSCVYRTINSVNGQILLRQAILDVDVDSLEGLDTIVDAINTSMAESENLESTGAYDSSSEDSYAAQVEDNNSSAVESLNENNNKNNLRVEISDDYSETNYSTNDQANGNSGTNAVTIELDNARALFGFGGFNATDIMEVLAEIAPNAIVSESRWLKLAEDLGTIANVADRAAARQVACRVFASFVEPGEDREGFTSKLEIEPCCSYYDFAAGLSLLSDSSVDEKLTVSFTLVDSNRDGEISFFEFCTLVLSYLKVVCSLSQLAAAKASALGLSLETIADAVAKEGYSSLSRGLSETLDIRDVCIVANDCMVLAGSPLF